MSGKHWLTLAAAGVLGVSALIVGKATAQVAATTTIDPYNPTVTTVTTVTTISAPIATPAGIVRPPVRDPARPPVRSPFAP